MALQTQDLRSSLGANICGLPIAVLENLAARVRGGGLFLVLLGRDGSPVYHDPQAALFFQRYVLPLLQYGDPTDPGLLARLQNLGVNSPVTVWDRFPGVILAAFPCVDRRQVTGTLILAGRSVDFDLTEEVLRVCSRLGLDAA